MMHFMDSVFLIPSYDEKLAYAAPAKQLYCSPNFKKSLLLSDLLAPDEVLILSAEHYLVGRDDVLQPYEKTLEKMTDDENRMWANIVISKLKKRFDFAETHFAIYAPEIYYKNLISEMIHYHLPFEGCSNEQISMTLDNLIKSIYEIKRNENI